ncbi:hypothetical protein ElyMa_004767600 [Elysia marginata]|uniref:Uncharacterized protein n=1 Tax=Elysia marginata TaxID=1093978 RepID=A0AAV4IGX8_9GAST|nr:hypothetical protein ElyMa_004767600 [Elysia marginata]
MYPSHQSRIQYQTPEQNVSITLNSIHYTRAGSKVRHSELMYRSHQSSIQRQTLGEDVSISPERYPMPDTGTEGIHLTKDVSIARHRDRMYPPH